MTYEEKQLMLLERQCLRNARRAAENDLPSATELWMTRAEQARIMRNNLPWQKPETETHP